MRLSFQTGSALQPPGWEVKLLGLQEVVEMKTCSWEIMGQGQGPLGYSYLVFIFVLSFSVSLKRNVLRMSPTVIRIWKHELSQLAL